MHMYLLLSTWLLFDGLTLNEKRWQLFSRAIMIYIKINLMEGKNHKVLFLFLYLYLIDWWLLYSISVISVIHQHELTIGWPMSPPSWISHLPPAHFHPSGLLQSPSLSSLGHTAISCWLSVHVCYCTCFHAALSFISPLPVILPPCPWSVLYVSIAALWAGSSVPSF